MRLRSTSSSGILQRSKNVRSFDGKWSKTVPPSHEACFERCLEERAIRWDMVFEETIISVSILIQLTFAERVHRTSSQLDRRR